MPVARTDRSGGGPRSVTKALRLLDLFTESRPQMGLTEIAGLAGLPKGTAHRLLLALEEEGFILHDSTTRKWGIGFQVVRLYNIFRKRMSLYQVVTPFAQALRDRVQETVSLIVEDGGDGICVERFDPVHDLRLHSPVGVRVPLHAGAGRKILLAYMRLDRRDQILAEKGLPRITSNTVVDWEQIHMELAQIREQGHSISFGEHNSGVTGLAAPLRDSSGEVVASLSLAGPSTRFTHERAQEALPVLLEAARTTSRHLGFRELK